MSHLGRSQSCELPLVKFRLALSSLCSSPVLILHHGDLENRGLSVVLLAPLLAQALPVARHVSGSKQRRGSQGFVIWVGGEADLATGS